MADTLSLSSQENILTLLVFSDTNAKTIASTVPLELYDNKVYRQIAEKAVAYLERYKKPAKLHIADLLEKELKADKHQLLEGTLRDIYYLNNEGVNEEYVMATLRNFLRQQKFKGGLIKAAQLTQEGRIEEAESCMLAAIRARDNLERVPLTLSYSDVASAIADTHDELLPIGIKELDMMGAVPVRKGLLTFLGLTNRGKSWFLIHVGKWALVNRYRVLHISLEMSSKKVLARYAQSMFAMSRRPSVGSTKTADIPVTRIEVGTDGNLDDIVRGQITRPAYMSKSGQRFLKHKLLQQKLQSRYKLRLSEFPTGALSVAQLEAYLDMLERHDNFIPDVLLLDYADLMAVNVKFLREEIGEIYKKLRGLAAARNMFVVTVSQTNRLTEEAKVVKIKDASEDFSKIMTSDIVLTYSQTEQERALGLARITVAKNRDDIVGNTVLISQAYAVGQFCLDSCFLQGNNQYFDRLLGSAQGIQEEGRGKFRRKHESGRERRLSRRS